MNNMLMKNNSINFNIKFLNLFLLTAYVSSSLSHALCGANINYKYSDNNFALLLVPLFSTYGITNYFTFSHNITLGCFPCAYEFAEIKEFLIYDVSNVPVLDILIVFDVFDAFDVLVVFDMLVDVAVSV